MKKCLSQQNFDLLYPYHQIRLDGRDEDRVIRITETIRKTNETVSYSFHADMTDPDAISDALNKASNDIRDHLAYKYWGIAFLLDDLESQFVKAMWFAEHPLK